jgi:hypothetical protein
MTLERHKDELILEIDLLFDILSCVLLKHSKTPMADEYQNISGYNLHIDNYHH